MFAAVRGDGFGGEFGDGVGVVRINQKFVIAFAREAKAVTRARGGGEVADADELGAGHRRAADEGDNVLGGVVDVDPLEASRFTIRLPE